MAGERYYNYNTQILDKSIDPLVSREFINENRAEVIKNIPVDEKTVFLFTKNSDNRLTYVKYVLQDDETYTGSSIVFSDVFDVPRLDIFAFNSYYQPTESFFFFYNQNNNVYLRSFYLKQGYINSEILVRENARIEKIDQIKESFFIIFRTLENKEIYNMVSNYDGELKIMLMFENDITRFEGKYDSVIKTQEIELPFYDIGEEHNTVVDQVGNGFIYFTGTVKQIQNDYSIKGYTFTDFGDVYMKMNKDSSDYTLIVRATSDDFITSSIVDKIILQTNNITIKSNSGNFIVDFSDNTSYVTHVSGFGYSYNDELTNIIITSKNVNDERFYKVYINNKDNEEYILEKTMPDPKVNDSYLKLIAFHELDYIALKNTALTLNAIKDVHYALEKQLISQTYDKTYYLNGKEIDDFLSSYRLSREGQYLVKLPTDVIPLSANYSGVEDDYKKKFWLKSGFQFNGEYAKNVTVYMEKDSTFINKLSNMGTIFAKSGCVVDLNKAKKFNVVYEEGAIIMNASTSTVIRREDNLVYDYSNIPISGAHFGETEDFNTQNALYFPILGADTFVEEIKIECISNLSTPQPYVDNGDGTLTDNVNQLMWLRVPTTIPQNKANKQNQAYNIAKNLVHLNYDDWRLPTVGEMLTLVGTVSISTSAYGGFDFKNAIKTGNYLAWTGSSHLSASPYGETADGLIYDYDIKNHLYHLSAVTALSATLGMYVRSANGLIKAVYDDGSVYQFPINKGQSLDIVKEGKVRFVRTSPSINYTGYAAKITVKQKFQPNTVKYPPNFLLNCSNQYKTGVYLPLNRLSAKEELSETVLPLFIDNSSGIPQSMFTNPTENIRIGEHLSQRFGLTPFILNYNNKLNGVTAWVPMTDFYKKVGVQYNIKETNLMAPVYSDYNVFSSQTYPNDEYFCAYHFDKLVKNTNQLVQEVEINTTGEIMLKGKTALNTYLREIKAINFFKKPAKYKTADFNVVIDVKDDADRDSFINNYDEIRKFVATVVKKWKPATTNLNDIIEKETLIMAQLLKNEYTQVLVGITSRQNSNVYYVRSADTGNINILSSSQNYNDDVDWLGVGKINTPYIKTGVTKISRAVKNIKIPFETRYANNSYRVYVFSPIDAKYYVVSKDTEGFIVESSSLVEQEVAWITLNTSQIINASLIWRNGIPNNSTIISQMDRSEEINNNSNRYEITFAELGYPEFAETDYSVILSTNKNINVWVENKTALGFTIRRSYAGEDVNIDLMCVKRNTKWWTQISG